MRSASGNTPGCQPGIASSILAARANIMGKIMKFEKYNDDEFRQPLAHLVKGKTMKFFVFWDERSECWHSLNEAAGGDHCYHPGTPFVDPQGHTILKTYYRGDTIKITL